MKSSDGRVYGNLSIRRVSGNQFQIHRDEYDFGMHKGWSRTKIFVANLGSVNTEQYMVALENHLKDNGFSSRLKVMKNSTWNKFVAWLNGDTTAGVLILDRYSRGAPIDKGVLGFARLGSNSSVVYDKGNYFGRQYNPSITDLINVTTHEIGHGVFSFDHSSNGVMKSHYRTGSSLINFNTNQIRHIKNSVWGTGN